MASLTRAPAGTRIPTSYLAANVKSGNAVCQSQRVYASMEPVNPAEVQSILETSSFSGLTGTLRSLLDNQVSVEAWNRWSDGRPRGSVVALHPQGELAKGDESNGQLHERARLWMQKPWLWRLETQTGPNQWRVVVIDGPTWWYWDGGIDASTNAASAVPGTRAGVGLSQSLHAMLRPAEIAKALRLVSPQRVTHAGRDALRVRGVPRDPQTPVIWPGADEYRLIVDVERGVLLHLGAAVNGRTIAIDEFEEILFDRPLPAGTFALDAPPEVTIRPDVAPSSRRTIRPRPRGGWVRGQRGSPAD